MWRFCNFTRPGLAGKNGPFIPGQTNGRSISNSNQFSEICCRDYDQSYKKESNSANSYKYKREQNIHFTKFSINTFLLAEYSSDSASENDSPQASPNHSDNQRISRGQLAAALLFAGTASLNSLSNIAERAVDDEEMATTSDTTPTPSRTSSFSTVDPSSSIQPTGNSQQYAAELLTMREMGLTEENSNLQALILCNGNVEAAVTLVLGIGNFT